MYRDILTKKSEKKFKFGCQCGHTELLELVCPASGIKAGEGFEHVCPVCRGPLVLLTEKGD
jgi:hypothetical protein